MILRNIIICIISPSLIYAGSMKAPLNRFYFVFFAKLLLDLFALETQIFFVLNFLKLDVEVISFYLFYVNLEYSILIVMLEMFVPSYLSLIVSYLLLSPFCYIIGNTPSVMSQVLCLLLLCFLASLRKIWFKETACKFTIYVILQTTNKQILLIPNSITLKFN